MTASRNHDRNKRKRNAEFVKTYCLRGKSVYECRVCGFEHEEFAVFDLHHIKPGTKTEAVSRMKDNGWTIAQIKEEIDKCILVCANCHRLIHAQCGWSSNARTRENEETQLNLFDL